MNRLSREFTLKEKILLGFLVLLLLGLVYYRFVDQPVREAIFSSNSDTQMYQTQLEAVQLRLMRLQGVKRDLDALEESGKMSYIGSYNNSQNEIAFLNDVLAEAVEFSIAFANVTRSGDLIRRNFTLQYKTKNYNDARLITKKLTNGEYRCLIGDVRCSVSDDGTVTINETATFYETMVGGTPDAGLPSENAAVKQ